MQPGIHEQAALLALSTLTTQVCIIGSGCGGATLAKKLTDAGIDVVVLEQGGYYPSSRMDQNELNMAGKLYAEHGLDSIDSGGNMLMYGHNVGGASVHYWADSYRTPPEKLALWQQRYGIEHHSEQDLAPIFAEIEANLNIHPATDEYFNPLNHKLRAASDALGWHGHRVPQARKHCAKSGHCMQGCLYDAKQSQMVTHLPQAIAQGAKVLADARALQFRRDGKRITALDVAVMDRARNQMGSHRFVVKADVFVVAAGGFNSAHFLLQQEFADQLPALGKHFSMNPSCMVHALFDEDIIQWRNIPAAWGVDEFRLRRYRQTPSQHDQYIEGGYLLMPNQLHPGTLAATLPLKGEQLGRWMSALPRTGGLICWMDDIEEELGEIRLKRNGQREVHYPYGPVTRAVLRDAIDKQVHMLLAMGARELLVAGHQAITLRSAKDLPALEALEIDAGGLFMASPHPGGGCRMGGDATQSVVNSQHQVHGFENLYVSDSSVFPTSSSLDPSLSIMAFSHIAAHSIRMHFA